MAHRTGSLAWALLGALLLGVPVGVLSSLLLVEETLNGISSEPTAFVQPPQLSDFDERTGVAATLTWVDGPALYAPAWSGIVGRVDVQPGDSVDHGDAIAVIDGTTRLAVSSPQPFYRPLGLDDRGPDVGWLHDALASLGYMEGVSNQDRERTSEATLLAIGGLATDLGISSTVSAFDPAWFVWLPQSLQVEAIELTVGSPAPPAGSAIAASRARLGAATLQTMDGQQLELDRDVSYLLEIAGEELSLDSEIGTVNEAGLARLSTALPARLDSASGTVRREQPVPVWALPSAAVMSNASGQLCVWIESGDQFEAVGVVVVAGRAGVTFIVPPMTAANVLHNPSQILAQPTCPSS